MNANAGGRSVLSRLPGSTFGARHRRAITRSSLCAGAILLVIAIAAPTFIVPSLKELPANIDYDVSTAPTRGILIDSAAFKASHPSASHSLDPACVGQSMPTRCYIETDVPLRASEKVTTASSSKKTTTLRAVSTLYAGDLDTPERKSGSDAKGQVDANNEIGSIHDEVVLNRHTAFPSKKPQSSLAMDLSALGMGDDVKISTNDFVRDGYQFRFPFGSERRSYRFFDAATGTATPIDFVNAIQQRGKDVYSKGIDVYQFSQDLGPVNLYDAQRRLMDNAGNVSEEQRQELDRLRRNIPASSWGLSSGAPIQMDPYYVATRTINVEPATGIITDNSVTLWVFYAQNYNEAKTIKENQDKELASPSRTMLHFDAQWDDRTKEARLHDIQKVIKPLNIWSKAVPWVTGVSGMILILAGLYLYFDARQAIRRPGGKSPETPHSL